MPAKLIKISDSPIRQPSNGTRTIIRTRDVRTGVEVSSPGSQYVNHHPQVIRNYLNQTVPAQQHLRTRNHTFCRGRDNPADRSFAVADTATTNNRIKIACDRGSRFHTRHSFDVGHRRSSTICDKSRFLNSHNQCHGVIAESVYKNLCNGTIGW